MERDWNGEGVGVEDEVENLGNNRGRKKPTKGKKGRGKVSFSADSFGGDGNGEDGGDLGSVKVSDDENESVSAFSSKKKPSKSKKKAGKMSFSVDAFGDEDGEDIGELGSGKVSDDEDDESLNSFSGKKKPSKSKNKAVGEVGSKVKKGGGKASFSVDAFGDEDVEDGGDLGVGKVSDDEDESLTVFAGKKKTSKSKKKAGGSAFAAFSEVGNVDEDGSGVEHLVSANLSDNDGDDEPVIEFTGKKKSSRPGKKANNVFASAYNVLNSEEEVEGETKEEDEDVPLTVFTGKKKSAKSSKKNNSVTFSAALLDDDENIDDDSVVYNPGSNASGHDARIHEEDSGMVSFSGKKKSSKKKSDGACKALDAGPGNTLPSLDKPDISTDDPKSKVHDVEDVGEIPKNKKKKKKIGRTAQEEDDLDKILAELGEAPPTVRQPQAPTALGPPPEGKVQLQPPVEDGADKREVDDEGVVESAAAKKKKKKKEKEKEKKAAASGSTAVAVDEAQEVPRNEAKGKVSDKKVPKHVREMQERLAKLREEEERKKREEEEKLRKEEEERRRQEELERLAEEKKRLKKEKEKEKMLKKKQEGKLLTAKQKEEARRLEAMRRQFLGDAGPSSLPTGDTGGGPTKRPKYQTKKLRPQSQANSAAVVDSVENLDEPKDTLHEVGSGLDFTETEKVDGMQHVEKPPEDESVEGNGVIDEEEDDEEWDAKSWDGADIKLPGKSSFDDEEVDSEPETVIQKEVKVGRQATTDAGPSAGTKAAVVGQKTSSTVSSTPQAVEQTKVTPVVDVVDKPKQQQRVKKASVSDAHPSAAENNLRSPICCIMGHVDTGKTKLLDCIRGTNVQEGEAGGITQQIGATYFPAENIRERTRELKADAKLNVPGLLVIDTPGHESFTNLRSRGSGLCDIAILVVDIMHGLEPQTIESLNLLKMRNTEFIVALNKVDRLYGWKACRNAPIKKTMKQQTRDVEIEFNMRVTQVITQFKEQGINSELYYKNKEMGETVSIVPTSAISGEGVPDLLLLLVQWAQKTMVEKLTYSNEIQCTVLEVKVVEGHGTTIDVVLVNGVLHEGDRIVVCGMQGPIVTTIRALLTPHPMRELRVKGTYLHHKEIKAAQGIKITAQGLEHAIAGTGLYVVGPDDDVDEIKETAMEDMRSVMNRIDKSGEGVYVQASTLGSLEALLEFLKTPVVNIPVSGIGIGPVHKKDVVKASVMLEKKKEYATILAFDVRVTPEARELADELGVRIFCADIIYHLFDQFKAYIDNLKEEKKKEVSEDAVFPCVLKIMPNCVFNKKDPIVLGVDVLEGIAKVGTPICIPQKEFIDIGRIASIENNHKAVDFAKKGQKVAIKIVGSNPEEQQKMFGRHFEIEDELVSRISRRSIDILKENYREDLSIEEWKLVVKLKNLFKIQ